MWLSLCQLTEKMTAVIGSVGATLPNKGNTACMYRAALLQSPKSSISVTEQQNPAYKTTRANTGTACSAGHTDRIYFGGGGWGKRGGLSYTHAHVFHFATQHMPVPASWVLPSHCSHRNRLGEAYYRCRMQGRMQVNIASWSTWSWNILSWKLLLSNGLLCGTFWITTKNDLSNDFYNTHQRPNPAFASFSVEVSWQQQQCWC